MRIEATAPTLQARDHLPGEGTEHGKDPLASPAAPADGIAYTNIEMPETT
jgi:hypothetical protein